VSKITWEEELQLLLVEDRDEAAGDDVVESLQEGGQLLPVAGQETTTSSHVIPDTILALELAEAVTVKHITQVCLWFFKIFFTEVLKKERKYLTQIILL
jgi:hypothetical protein